MSHEHEIAPALTPEEWDRGIVELRDAGRANISPVEPSNSHCMSQWRPGELHISCGECVVWGHGVQAMTKDRHAIAALCLYGQPFGFTQQEAYVMRRLVAYESLAAWTTDRLGQSIPYFDTIASVARKIAFLLPLETP